MMSKTFSRIVAVILAILMVLSVIWVLFQVIAADARQIAVAAAVNPATGDTGTVVAAVVVGALAVFAIIFCVILPKLKKGEGKKTIKVTHQEDSFDTDPDGDE